MKRAIRFNRTICQPVLQKLQKGCPDPRGLLDTRISTSDYTRLIARLRIDGVFKTTSCNRFPASIRVLAGLRFPSPPVVVDVGASDGSTSLDVIEAMDFSRYYVTDRHIEALAYSTKRGVFFCDAATRPFLYANRFFVVYNDMDQTFPLERGLVRKLFLRFDAAKCEGRRKMVLMNPELLSRLGNEIRLESYNIFEAWRHQKADLVIAANILNRGYFTDVQLCQALRNIKNAMKEGGRLAVIENRPAEQSNIFRFEEGRFMVEHEIGHGCDIKALVTDLERDVSEMPETGVTRK